MEDHAAAHRARFSHRRPSGDEIVPGVTTTGLVLLWISALLTLYTGWDYFRAGVKQLVAE